MPVKGVLFLCLPFSVLFGCISGQVITVLLLKTPMDQDKIVGLLEDMANQNGDFRMKIKPIDVEGEEADYEKVCSELDEPIHLMLDMSWYGSDFAKNAANDLNLPYVRVDVSISPFLKFLEKYLDYRNSSDVVIVFDDSQYVDQSLYYFMGTTRLRLIVMDTLDNVTSQRLKDMRPIPNNIALIASTTSMASLVHTAFNEALVLLPERWNLVFLDFNQRSFDRSLLNKTKINILALEGDVCCLLQNSEGGGCSCPLDFNVQRSFVKLITDSLVDVFKSMIDGGLNSSVAVQCNETFYDDEIRKQFISLFEKELEKHEKIVRNSSGVLHLFANGTIEVENEIVARYGADGGLSLEKGKNVKAVKPFYRIGTTHALPWSYQEYDPNTKRYFWTGYCIDFVQRLSELMNFDYELVAPKKGTFGMKINGTWDGVIGDLATGETDMAFTAMVMTADKEEVVDFIAPYFEQSGISIVMRKPVRKASLFKFMTVLKLEVWLSIVGALVVTGFMVWFLDKYSPYSAKNNKKAYPYPCREFTLKESFWFALTSFTPQGGGEAPKALSGRTLVAAYWLFVVLMLATFTANLAAFLTVERMQTPVQSLEQLARQSRINYTVVMGSDTHQYFINMKNAEDTLYRMWKELTLNASTDETQYRVWDYPIREQYGHILLAINDSMPVADAEEGFRKVNEYLDADFAFIHDSSEIKYEISRNCNLTEVGEVFAEKPYAVAVQQGSHLQDEISKRILDLQKDRFFEELQAKYWNHSGKGKCQNSDDSEGITLESLGGVFIATLFGLALAMVTLAGEVLYYRRKRKTIDKTTVAPSNELQLKKGFGLDSNQKSVTIGTTFVAVAHVNQQRVSHISLYPRGRNRLSRIN